MSIELRTTVVVVGGSLVGLSAAVFFAARKVPIIVVEKHKSSSPHPRAIGFTARTLELYRSVGLQERIPTSKHGHGRPRRAKVESLAGEWHEESFWQQQKGQGPPSKNGNGQPTSKAVTEQHQATVELSPCGATAIAQDNLEPLLRERAVELGADLLLGHSMTAFAQNANHVTVNVTNDKLEKVTIVADYMIGCDGAKSGVRESLGINMTGVGHLRTLRSILFRCPKIEKYLDRGVVQFSISRPDFDGFLTTYRDGRWALMWNDESGKTVPEEEQKQQILSAIGDESVFFDDVELITQGQWSLKGAVADTFSSGRIFLAGDAAHTLPPNRGGWGANTGIADVHNLAWKIDAVHRGLSSPALLETYSAERQPVARLRHDQIFIRDDYRDHVRGSDWEARTQNRDASEIIGDEAMELGQIYKSNSVITGVESDDQLPAAQGPEQWAGQPGTRAPHLPLSQAGKSISTLDLFGAAWVVLSVDGTWASVTEEVRTAMGWSEQDLQFLQVGKDVEVVKGNTAFEQAFGLGDSGATLIRPDGYIGWRAKQKPQEPVLNLKAALKKVLAHAEET